MATRNYSSPVSLTFVKSFFWFACIWVNQWKGIVTKDFIASKINYVRSHFKISSPLYIWKLKTQVHFLTLFYTSVCHVHLSQLTTMFSYILKIVVVYIILICWVHLVANVFHLTCTGGKTISIFAVNDSFWTGLIQLICFLFICKTW